jgi:CRISPR-associated protein Cas1
MGAGLHPALGVHHKNAGNPMRLADDLVEPFRPDADFTVFHLLRNGCDTLTPDVKRTLAGLLEAEVTTKDGMSPLRTAIQNAATSLALIYEGSGKALDLPQTQPPLWQIPALLKNHGAIQRTQTNVDDGDV